MIAVIDYECANLTSLAEALRRLQVDFKVTREPSEIRDSTGIILPGVGHFGHAGAKLEEFKLKEVLVECASNGTYLFGICVGMQLLADWSEEAGPDSRGLGLIPAIVRDIGAMGVTSSIPHVGWNELRFSNPDHPMISGVAEGGDVYFVHSFALQLENPTDLVATTHHDVDLVAAVARDRIWGAQFHPEKSSRVGMKFLKNFVELMPC